MAKATGDGSSLLCAVVQLCSTPDLKVNLKKVEELVRAAARGGAQLIALPENCLWIRIDPSAVEPAEHFADPKLLGLSQLASELQVHLLLGSIPEASGDPARPYKTSVWIDSDGRILAKYQKLHLFDVNIPEREMHQESASITPGNKVVCAATPWGPFGMSICYDLRFPELYRRLTTMAARVLCVPSAFTVTTGKLHWHTLLKARAIENQCYVIAPAQWGHHGGDRRCYGHSLIVDPWGTVMVDMPDGEGFQIAELNLATVTTVRGQIPCLINRREDIFGK